RLVTVSPRESYRTALCAPVGPGVITWRIMRKAVRMRVTIGIAVVTVFVLAFTFGVGAGGKDVAFPDPATDAMLATARTDEALVVSGGCFWGVQAVFQHMKGVVTATSGYAGGTAKTANYEVVSSGTTGHAESVRIVFDRSQVTVGQILKIFFA